MVDYDPAKDVLKFELKLNLGLLRTQLDDDNFLISYFFLVYCFYLISLSRSY